MTKFDTAPTVDVYKAPLVARVGVAGAVAVGIGAEYGEEAKMIELRLKLDLMIGLGWATLFCLVPEELRVE